MGKILKPNQVSPTSNHSWKHLAGRPSPQLLPIFSTSSWEWDTMPPPTCLSVAGSAQVPPPGDED